MSLADRLKALNSNNEKTNAEAPNAALLNLFSDKNLKRRKLEAVENPPTKKQKIQHPPIIQEDKDESDSDSDSMEEETSDQEEIEVSVSEKSEENKEEEEETKLEQSESDQPDQDKTEEQEAIERERNERTIFIGNLPTKAKAKVCFTSKFT